MIETTVADVERASPPVSPRKALAVTAIMILLITLGVYRGALRSDFIWDDQFMIVENPAVRSLSSGLRSFVDAGTMASIPEFRIYRPLRTLSFAMDYAVWELDAPGYHLTNLLLHGSVVLLLFFVLVQLTANAWVAAVLALLFGVHPGHSEAVFWIKGRADLLCALFYLLAFEVYRRGKEPLSLSTASIVMLLFLLSVFSKEMAISLALMLAGYDVIVVRRISARRVILWGLVFCVTLAFLVLRSRMLAGIEKPTGADRPFAVLMQSSFHCMLVYARQSILPLRHHIDYVGLPDQTTRLLAAGGAVVLVAVAASIIVLWRRGLRLAAFGIYWFLVGLSPVLLKNFAGMVPTTQMVAERFLYLPLIGLPLALAEWFRRPAGRAQNVPVSKLWRPALAAVAVLFAVLTVKRSAAWVDEESLYEASIDARPVSVRVLGNLASLYISQGRFADAAALLASHDAHRTPALTMVRGYALAMDGKEQEGIALLREGIEATEENEKGYLYLGLVHGRQERHAEAVECFKRGLARSPQPDLRSRLLNNLGIACRETGDDTAAEKEFLKAAESYPLNKDPLENLGALYWRRAQWRKAAEIYTRLHEIDSGNTQWRKFAEKARALREGA